MNRTILTLGTIIILSVIAYLLMMYVLEWTQKKSAIIAFGAGAAMILFDVVLAGMKRKRTD